jgi:diguanylate cyclase (GGDEF)-like protein
LEDNRPLKTDQPSSDLKSAYYDYKFNASKKYVRAIIVIAAVFNLFLLIPDIAMGVETSQHASIIAGRLVFSLMLLVFYAYTERIKKFNTFFAIITICELCALGIFIFVLASYRDMNILIQAMGLITVIIIIFFIPSRWDHTLVIAVAGEAAFLLCILVIVDFDPGTDFWAAAVYTVIAILLCAITARNAEIHQFNEFIAKRELERLSSTDYLTEAVNRYKIMEEAERWMEFCRRHDLPLSLTFIDVDNLKMINDRYGHHMGDMVLANLAKVIRSQLRGSDILARWGGDEFIVLLPSTDILSAGSLTERIRASIKKSAMIDGMSITCSFGVASMEGEQSFEDLVRQADDLMYNEKKRSRPGNSKRAGRPLKDEMNEDAKGDGPPQGAD